MHTVLINLVASIECLHVTMLIGDWVVDSLARVRCIQVRHETAVCQSQPCTQRHWTFGLLRIQRQRYHAARGRVPCQ